VEASGLIQLIADDKIEARARGEDEQEGGQWWKPKITFSSEFHKIGMHSSALTAAAITFHKLRVCTEEHNNDFTSRCILGREARRSSSPESHSPCRTK
jgi:hypothetical protein